MSSTKLFSPIFANRQPAAQYNGKKGSVIKIYFSLAAVNVISQIQGVYVSILDPTKSELNNANSMLQKGKKEFYTEVIKKKSANQYYLEIDISDKVNFKTFDVHKDYSVKLVLLGKDGSKSNKGANSTLIRLIPKIKGVYLAQENQNLFNLEKINGYIQYEDASIKESIKKYHFQIRNIATMSIVHTSAEITNTATTSFSFDIGQMRLADGDYQILFYYETVHGYSPSEPEVFNFKNGMSANKRLVLSLYKSTWLEAKGANCIEFKFDALEEENVWFMDIPTFNYSQITKEINYYVTLEKYPLAKEKYLEREEKIYEFINGLVENSYDVTGLKKDITVNLGDNIVTTVELTEDGISLLNEIKLKQFNQPCIERAANMIDEPLKFTIQRASLETDYSQWETVAVLYDCSILKTYKIEDFLIEFNQWYVYRILVSQEYISGYVDTYFTNAQIECDGDIIYKNLESEIPGGNMYLLGNEAQLYVKYNPVITGFKWVKQEQITNTLGGRYPVINVNGVTKYRQFSLSGTLSFEAEYGDYFSLIRSFTDSLGNDHSLLFSEEGRILLLDVNRFKALVSEQMFTAIASNKDYLEKLYRKITMDFLTDGKPKVFKSDTEENMIVFLSNVSFTPNKTLGRVIYDFSCTVTEMCEYNYNNLKKYGLTQNNHSYFEILKLCREGGLTLKERQDNLKMDIKEDNGVVYITPYISAKDLKPIKNQNSIELKAYDENGNVVSSAEFAGIPKISFEWKDARGE